MSTIPAWISIALLNTMEPHRKWTPQKEALGKHIVHALENFLPFHVALTDQQKALLLEVNPHDNCTMYSQQEPKRTKP